MSFSGSVSQPSHEGGLLVSFEGRAPGLYTGIRIVGGKFLGRVDSVIGSVNKIKDKKLLALLSIGKEEKTFVDISSAECITCTDILSK